MKLSLFTACINESDIKNISKTLSKAGYTGVELRVHNDGRNVTPEDVPHRAREIKKICDDNNLRIPDLATYVPLNDPGLMNRVITGAVGLSCKQVRFQVPVYDGKTGYNDIFNKTRDDLAQVEQLAKTADIKILLELHFGSIIPSVSSAIRLVSGYDPEHIGIIFDPGNMIFEGMENWRMGIEILGKYLAHVHVKNGYWEKAAGKWNIHWSRLDEGLVNWSQLVSDLNQTGYDGYLSVEDFRAVPDTDKIIEDYEFLVGLTKQNEFLRR
jgi:sugar phosphate isomerase/epimerase